MTNSTPPELPDDIMPKEIWAEPGFDNGFSNRWHKEKKREFTRTKYIRADLVSANRETAQENKPRREVIEALDEALNKKWTPDQIRDWQDVFSLPLSQFQIIEEAARRYAALSQPPVDVEALKREIQAKLKPLKWWQQTFANAARMMEAENLIDQVIDYLAATGRLQQPRVPADKWEHINTAPMDGTDVLALGIVEGKWTKPTILYFEQFEDRGWLCGRTHKPVQILPSRWQPLPPAPGAAPEVE